MESEQASLNIEQVFGILRRRALWVVVCVVIVGAAAYGYSKQKTKKYTATAAIAFNTNALSQEIAGLSPTSTDNLVAQQVSNLELVKLGNTAARTAALLGRGLTDAKVSESVSVGVKGETDIVEVSSTSTSPELAAEIANTYSQQFVKEQQTANHRLFTSALKLVDRQLAKLSAAQRFGSDGLDLEDRAHTLAILTELGYNNAEVAGKALAPTSPSSPRSKRNTLIGVVLGLLLGLALAFVIERFDRRIREPEDLQSIYRLPLVGLIPESDALSRVGALPPAEAEAFNLIRAHLRFLNVDRDICTVVVASPAPKEGKTTVARHLAEAAARLGSRVLLLEADLRHPTIAQSSSITPGPGLAGVLIGAVQMDKATQATALEPSSAGGSVRTLDVLAAGAALPLNPGELLGSSAMDAVLARAKAAYDLVIIDTPPLNAVSDAFPLLPKVDGVVVVGRIGRSRRDDAEWLERILLDSGARLLGVIANGSKAGGPIPYPVGGSEASPIVSSANGSSSVEELTPTAKT